MASLSTERRWAGPALTSSQSKQSQRSASHGGGNSKSCLCPTTLYRISANRPGCTRPLQVHAPIDMPWSMPKCFLGGLPSGPTRPPLQQRLGTLQRRACPDPLRLAVELSMGMDQKTAKTSTTKKPTSSSMNNKEAPPSLAVGRSQRPDLDPLPAWATRPVRGKDTKHGFSDGKFVWWHSHVAAKSSKMLWW